jgi:hypothetical protein
MVPISSDIYSGAAVVMDNRSLFDYMQKIEDRRAKRALAEQEAADNYAKDIGKNLTPTGMKTNDIPHFIQLQQEIRQLSDKYRSTKNPLDKFALNNKADEALLFINESKAAVKEGEQPTSALGNVGNRNKVDFENLAQDLDLHNLPLKDPRRKKIGALSNYFYPEQFDEVETFNQAAKGIEKSELGTTIVKGQKIIPVGYGENAIKSIAENYLKIVDINPDATRYYKGKLKNLPAEKVAEAVDRVKKYYPQLDIDDDEPSFLKLSDAIEAAEQRTSQKIENASRISVSTGDSAAKGEFIDYYKQLSDLADKPFTFNIKPGGPKMLGVPMRKITSTSLQKLIIDIANDLNPNKSYNQTNLYVKKLDDGTIRIIDADDNIDLGQINEADINIPTQAASPEKRAAARAAKVIKPAAAPAFVFPNNIKTF